MSKIELKLAPCDRELPAEEQLAMRVIERAAIQTALETTGGRRDAAAKLLGIDRKTLYRNLTWDPEIGACGSCGK